MRLFRCRESPEGGFGMRVPRVCQAVCHAGQNAEALELLKSGYPVRLPESSLPSLPENLRQAVSNWPNLSLGTKNPSWSGNGRRLKPHRFVQSPCANEFESYLCDFQKKSSEVLKLVLGFQDQYLHSDRVTWRPYELATVSRRWNARDDLFHIDSFSSRPTNGRRILRLFFNASSTDSIVWSHTFNLKQYIENGFFHSLRQNSQVASDSTFDGWLSRVHDQMKRNEQFQETAPRVLHRFAPGDSWVALTDACLHSHLRGEWLMDASWFVSCPALMQSEYSPLACFKGLSTPSAILEVFSRKAA